jgi:hypothetical protein
MKSWERWAINATTIALVVSGLAYFWMKYLIRIDDPFAVVNHPWQSSMLHLHVLVSPAFVFVFGVVLSSHILKKLRTFRPPNRKSGILILGAFIGMLSSGYLLQVIADEFWLRAMVIVHVGAGTLFSIAYAVHLVVNVRLARSRIGAAVREVA